jgi:hypothetical protein
VADGFLGRWSQRKQAVREGKTLDEPVAKPPGEVPAVHSTSAEHDGSQSHGAPQTKPGDGPAVALVAQTAEPAPAAPPPPSLEDVQRLTNQSDFAPFVARDVAPEVRNAAMKKLFADPHYNVMDRLDIYIDDYSKPDPLPESMLRQMASAKFLKLFEDEEQDEPQSRVRDDANTPVDHSVAQSGQPPQTGADHLTENKPQALGTDHDHTDLRLQPNHAAGPQEPGRGTE